MQDKEGHLKAQKRGSLRSEIDHINKITLEVRESAVVGFIWYSKPLTILLPSSLHPL